MCFVTKSLLGLWVIPMAFVPCATAGPAARNSVVSLANEADAIVTGSVQATVVNGTMDATIQVERVLKGSITPGSSISLTWTSLRLQNMPTSPVRDTRPSIGHGVFFLKQNGGGAWSILLATVGDASWHDTYIPTPSTVPPGLRDAVSGSLPANASTLDNVLVEMVIATEAGAPMPFDLVNIFQQSRSPVLAAAFTRFLSKPDNKLVAIGLRGSILTGDPSVIATIHRKYATLSAAIGWPALLDEIRFYYTNPAPQAVQTLGQIATDTNTGTDLRIATAIALARIHTQSALSYLAELLDDPNIALQAAATGGLSSFANNVPMGSHEPAAGPWRYRTDETIAHSVFDEVAVSQRESYYVGFWKAWWQQNQGTLAQ